MNYINESKYAAQGIAQQGAAAMMGYAADCAEREAEIPASLNRLERRLSELRDLADTLDARLTGTVARSSPPVNATAGSQIKAAMQTGYGSQIDNLHDRAETVIAILRGLSDRLEV